MRYIKFKLLVIMFLFLFALALSVLVYATREQEREWGGTFVKDGAHGYLYQTQEKSGFA